MPSDLFTQGITLLVVEKFDRNLFCDIDNNREMIRSSPNVNSLFSDFL